MSKTRIDGGEVRRVQQPEPSKSNEVEKSGGPKPEQKPEAPKDEFQYKAANDNAPDLTGAGRANPAKSVRDAKVDYNNFTEMARINADPPGGKPGTWSERSALNNEVFANHAAARAGDKDYLATLVGELTSRPPKDGTVSLTTLSQLEGPQRQAVVNALRAAYEKGTLTDEGVFGSRRRPSLPNDPVAALWNEARQGAVSAADAEAKEALDLVGKLKDGATVATSVVDALGSKLGLSAEHLTGAANGFASLGNGAANVADALMRLPGATAEQRPELLKQLARGMADVGVGVATFHDLENKVPNLRNAMRASGLGNLLDGALTFFTPGHSTEQGLEAAAKLALGTMQLVPALSTPSKFMDFGLAGLKLAGGLKWMAETIDEQAPQLGDLLRKSFI